MKKAYDEISFKVNQAQERNNPRLFNSVVNHISDVDLDHTPESKLDGEHFLIKASPEALNENQKTESLKSSFGPVV